MKKEYTDIHGDLWFERIAHIQSTINVLIALENSPFLTDHKEYIRTFEHLHQSISQMAEQIGLQIASARIGCRGRRMDEYVLAESRAHADDKPYQRASHAVAEILKKMSDQLEFYSWMLCDMILMHGQDHHTFWIEQRLGERYKMKVSIEKD
jgi:hypothetical protein